MHKKTDLTRAILYSVSGGVLTAAFGLLGTAQAHAEPRDTAGTPSGPVKKPAPATSGSANVAERKKETAENNAAKLRKKAQEKTKGQSANAAERHRENSEKKEEEAVKNSTSGSSNAADRRQANSEKRKEEADRKPKPASEDSAEEDRGRQGGDTGEKKGKDGKGDEKKGEGNTVRLASTEENTSQVRNASYSRSTESGSEEEASGKKDAVPLAPPPRVVVDRDTKKEVGTVEEVLANAEKSRSQKGNDKQTPPPPASDHRGSSGPGPQGGARAILDSVLSAGSQPEQPADFPMSVSGDSEKNAGSGKAGTAPESDNREPVLKALDALRNLPTTGGDPLDQFGRPRTEGTRTAEEREKQPDNAANPSGEPQAGGEAKGEKGANAPVQMPQRLHDLIYGEPKTERTDPLLPTARDVEEVGHKPAGPAPSHLKGVLTNEPAPEREDQFPLILPRADGPVPKGESTSARPLPVREPEKSAAEQVEEAIESGLAQARQWAQGEIDQEKNAPDKNADWATWARRAAAGGYASLHDNVEMAGEALDLLNRAKDGDPEAQREIEQRAKDTVDGIVNTATEAWNDPQGTWNRTVENAEKAVENFKDAPASGIGGILGDLAGPGKFTKPLKALDAVTPDRDGRPSEPSGTHAPASEQPGNTTVPGPQSTPTDNTDPRDAAGAAAMPGADSRRSGEGAGRGPIVVPMPVTQVPNLSRAGKPADRPSNGPAADDDSPRRDTRESAGTPSGNTDEDPQRQSRPETAASARDTNEAPRCATPNSFVPGTPVLLADGTYKPIEQITLGDHVLATDPVTGLTQARPVIALIPGQGLKELVRITVDTDGDQGNATGVVTATDEHPFWTTDDGRWTDAEDLRKGDLLRTPDGRQLEIIDVHEWTQQQQVHNFTVEGLHTYYVNAGGQDVLTHNKCVEQGQAGSFRELNPGTPGDGLEAHHVPQKAMGYTSENDGAAVVLPRAEHVKTRTWGSRGKATLAAETGMPFRDVLARDLWDLRRIAQTFHGDPGYYNEAIKQVLAYYREHFPELMQRSTR